MALPKLNDSPKYTMTIPSTGKKIKFRPYLVKEEKVLLMAVESQDMKTGLSAVVDTISACCQDEINVDRLTTFDVEYMFTQMRAKSSGESVKIGLSCKKCEQLNEVDVTLDDLKVNVPKVEKVHPLNDEITIELRYPPYSVFLDMDFEDGDDAENTFFIAGKCIDAIQYDDERIECDDVPTEELTEFLESMTKEQFKIIMDFVETMPKLEKNVKYDCIHCSHKNTLKLEGMQSFF